MTKYKEMKQRKETIEAGKLEEEEGEEEEEEEEEEEGNDKM